MKIPSILAALRAKFGFPLRNKRRGMRTVGRSIVGYVFGKRSEGQIFGLRMWVRIRSRVLLSATELGHIVKRTEAKIWIDGEEAFPRMLRHISHAKHTILIQMFLWKDDETGRMIARALVEAADRGVTVDIRKDSTGDVFEFDRDFITTKEDRNGVWHRFWNHPRISIQYLKDLNHAKVLIIDDQILLLAGMNIADEYRHDWHDYMIELRGSRFVDQYLLMEPGLYPEQHIHLIQNTATLKQVRPTLTRLIEEAELWIVLEQAYVSDKKILKHLARKTHEGVQVTLILPKNPDLHHHANSVSVRYLLHHANLAKCQILLYPKMVHGKAILIDRNKAFVGSANLMASSLDTMGELNVLVEGRHRRVVRRLRDQLRIDILISQPLISSPRLWMVTKLLAYFGL